jgi:DNA segregation ATPase FtsK/SpoIIIE-like protein
VLLIVDELANLLAVMDRDTSKALQRDLATIAAEGRKFGVHLAACTQKPLSEVTGSLTKSNMAVRFVGLMVGWQDAQTAADMPGTGAERLAGNGDFIYRNGPLVQRFQAPLVLPLSAITAANNAWRSADPSAIHAELEALVNDRPQVVHQSGYTGGAEVVPTGAPAGIPVDWPIAQNNSSMPTSAPVQFPLPRNRPPTPAEAMALRELYAKTGSQNQTVQAAYGTKSQLLMAYVKQALEGGDA